jgi:hypothetical protein
MPEVNMKNCLFAFCIFVSSFCEAQKKIMNLIHDSITTSFDHSYLSFSLNPSFVLKPKIIKQSGEYSPGATNTFGIEGGIDYHINLKNNYFIMTGVRVGISARNFQLLISKNDFSPNLTADVIENGAFTREYDFYLSIPLWLEKTWELKNHHQLNFLGGVNLRYLPGIDLEYITYSQQDVNGQNVIPFQMNLMMGNNKRPFLNYNIGGGYAVLLKNNNLLRCDILANISATKVINGTYIIDVTGKPESTGTYSASLSFIGLSFSYIFTGVNKRLLKLYEKDNK